MVKELRLHYKAKRKGRQTQIQYQKQRLTSLVVRRYQKEFSIQKMGLSSLPAPSEGLLCVILINTAYTISIFKGILRTILSIIGVSDSSTSLDVFQNQLDQSFELNITPSEDYILEFRKRTPTLRFDSVCSCKETEHDCSVCLTQFEAESEINRLFCGHLFHKVCLDKWLDYWNITCPLCRTPLIPEDDIASCFW